MDSGEKQLVRKGKIERCKGVKSEKCEALRFLFGKPPTLQLVKSLNISYNLIFLFNFKVIICAVIVKEVVCRHEKQSV